MITIEKISDCSNVMHVFTYVIFVNIMSICVITHVQIFAYNGIHIIFTLFIQRKVSKFSLNKKIFNILFASWYCKKIKINNKKIIIVEQ